MSITTPAALAAEFVAAAQTAGHRAGSVVIATAAAIQRDAKLFAAVDTGFLRQSITRESRRHRYGAESEIGPEAEYGIYLEEGTFKMAPQPFMEPAGQRNTEPFVQALADIAGWEAGSMIASDNLPEDGPL